MEDVKKLNIPTTPGSYQYYDKSGMILYIGKAANLRNRIFSYWRSGAKHTPAKRAMVEKVAKIKWIEVGSEIEALLLEANLIKKFQPPFNIDLRDDKRHLYIKITEDDFPRILTTRSIDKSGKYFGPFTSSLAVRETLKAVAKIFPYGRFAIMPASQANKRKSRRYPEIYGVPSDRKEYLKTIKEISAFLVGKRKNVEKGLKAEIENLQKDLSLKSKNSKETEERIRRLKFWLLQMKNVLAHSNVLSLQDKYFSDTAELAKIFALPKVPDRIEGYDISNLFGREAVGSMAVFTNGEPDKKEYRKFKIKNINISSRRTKGRGDTDMLKEILERRFNNSWPQPDLIVIDGGKGQLSAGLAVLKKIKADIPILAISKGEGLRSAHAPDKIFFPGAKRALVLPLASPALHVIKRVRDEAHRFAIGFHRQRRQKSIFAK